MSCDVRIYIDKWQYNSLPMQTERHGRSGLCGKAVYAGSLRSGSAKGGGVCIKGVVAGKNGRECG